MAAAKDVTACFQLAEWYDHGIRGEPDHQKAYDYYTKAAQQMYNPAMLKLAGYLNDEKDPQYNPEEAFHIYKSIADDRTEIYPEASYQTGLHYLKGKGVDKNTKEAFRYISNAVRHNYAPAIYQLGLMYIDGDGVALNQETAFKLSAGFKRSIQRRSGVHESTLPHLRRRTRGKGGSAQIRRTY